MLKLKIERKKPRGKIINKAFIRFNIFRLYRKVIFFGATGRIKTF